MTEIEETEDTYPEDEDTHPVCNCPDCRGHMAEDYEEPDKFRRSLQQRTNGKRTCQRCNEKVPLDDLTLCFHSISMGCEPLLKVVCLACRQDRHQIWQPWSLKVPRCV